MALTSGQRTRVMNAVRNHSQLGPLLKGRARIVMAEPHTDVNAGRSEAVVGIYDYEKDRTLVAHVDSRRARVLSVAEAPAPFQLSDEEEREAESLARSDKRVRSFLGRRPMNPLTRLYFPTNKSRHRHAIVFLRPNSSRRSYAVVDLTERRVVELLSATDLAG
jgi:hypothetical protein